MFLKKFLLVSEKLTNAIKDVIKRPIVDDSSVDNYEDWRNGMIDNSHIKSRALSYEGLLINFYQRPFSMHACDMAYMALEVDDGLETNMDRYSEAVDAGIVFC